MRATLLAAFLYTTPAAAVLLTGCGTSPAAPTPTTSAIALNPTAKTGGSLPQMYASTFVVYDRRVTGSCKLAGYLCGVEVAARVGDITTAGVTSTAGGPRGNVTLRLPAGPAALRVTIGGVPACITPSTAAWPLAGSWTVLSVVGC